MRTTVMDQPLWISFRIFNLLNFLPGSDSTYFKVTTRAGSLFSFSEEVLRSTSGIPLGAEAVIKDDFPEK
jgi:hypothetical protein